mgnify:CR=1 FL=1
MKEVRRLLNEIESEEIQKAKAESDNMVCRCTHKHIEHHKTHSVNYSAGVCRIENCDCRGFVINNQKIREEKR